MPYWTLCNQGNKQQAHGQISWRGVKWIQNFRKWSEAEKPSLRRRIKHHRLITATWSRRCCKSALFIRRCRRKQQHWQPHVPVFRARLHVKPALTHWQHMETCRNWGEKNGLAEVDSSINNDEDVSHTPTPPTAVTLSHVLSHRASHHSSLPLLSLPSPSWLAPQLARNTRADEMLGLRQARTSAAVDWRNASDFLDHVGWKEAGVWPCGGWWVFYRAERLASQPRFH